MQLQFTSWYNQVTIDFWNLWHNWKFKEMLPKSPGQAQQYLLHHQLMNLQLSCQTFLMLPNHIMEITLWNMTTLIIIQLLVPHSVCIHEAFLQKSLRLLTRNLSICYMTVSSNHPLAVGHHRYTWCPKRIQGIDIFAAIIMHSTMPQCQTDTPSLTIKISQLCCMGPISFLS